MVMIQVLVSRVSANGADKRNKGFGTTLADLFSDLS